MCWKTHDPNLLQRIAHVRVAECRSEVAGGKRTGRVLIGALAQIGDHRRIVHRCTDHGGGVGDTIGPVEIQVDHLSIEPICGRINRVHPGQVNSKQNATLHRLRSCAHTIPPTRTATLHMLSPCHSSASKVPSNRPPPRTRQESNHSDCPLVSRVTQDHVTQLPSHSVCDGPPPRAQRVVLIHAQSQT